MGFEIPNPITVQRLFDSLGLETIRKNEFYEEILALPIQSIGLQEHTLSLPLTGIQMNLEPQGNLVLARVICKEKEEQSLLLSSSIPWLGLCEQMMSWVEREQGRILARSETFFQRLIERLKGGNELVQVLQELKKTLNLDLFLINKQSKVVAWEGGDHLPISPISFVAPKLSDLRSLELGVNVTLLSGQWVDSSYESIPLTWYPLADPRGVVGYIGLATKPETVNQIDRLFLYKTATLLFLELIKAKSIEETERHHYRDFLFDLLYNNFDSLEVVQSRGRLWGIDLTKPYLVVVGEIPGFDPVSDELLFQELLDKVSWALRASKQTIFLERNDQLVLLFPLESMLPPSQWNFKAKQFLTPLLLLSTSLPEERQVVFGLGNVYDSPRFIHRSFQEAKSALELGQLLNLPERIFPFQDMGVMRLLLNLDQQELKDFRNEVLEPLLKFDQENNLHLEETLLAYLAANGDLNLAGERLFLHPNTLRYRVKKIAEILDRDLSNFENRMNLYIALKIGRLKSLWID